MRESAGEALRERLAAVESREGDLVALAGASSTNGRDENVGAAT